MSLRLSFRTPDGEVRAFDLTMVSESLVLGRDRDMVQLVIPDPQVSRAHCVIKRVEQAFVLEDLGSRNGSWVNDQRIQSVPLKAKDEIRIGSTKLTVQRSGSMSGEYADSLLGKTLNGFELQEVLGQGSYGTVYRGLQVALNRPVAVKVLAKKHQAHPDRVKAFLEEARRAGRLNHPNLVQVHDVCEIEGQYFLVMELMTGGSMSDRMRVDKRLESECCLHILRDIGHALGYAEAQRLVHRDVKPDNVLVNDEGVYKLADLGIAAPIADDGMARQARAFGSAHYVAPEQARGGNIDGRADIYGLGATLFHLLAGQPMYSGTSREIVTAHIRQPIPDLAELAPDANPALVALAMRMLAKEPEQRPASGNDVAEEAERLLSQPVGAANSGRSGRLGARGGGGRRRRVRRRRRR